MAVKGLRVAVAATAVSLFRASGSGARVLVKNNSATALDLGDQSVATGAGYGLGNLEAVEVWLGPGDELFGVSVGGGTSVHVLRTG